MTPFRMVVSWLAFLFFLWRTALLTFAYVQEVFRMRETTFPYGGSLTFVVDSSVRRVLPWGILWMLPVAAVMAPWALRFLDQRRRISPCRELDDPRSLAWNTAGRWGFAVLFVGSLFLLPSGVAGFLWESPYVHSWFASLFDIVRQLIPFTLAVLLIAPDLTRFSASGLTGFADRVFFPGDSEARPPYSLKLARHYVESRRWADAENEFARVLEWHPDQREAWEGRLALAFCRDDRREPAPEDVLALGLAALPDAADKTALHESFTRNQPGVI